MTCGAPLAPYLARLKVWRARLLRRRPGRIPFSQAQAGPLLV
ncbi:MAG: hypothetical protein AAF092_17910 [Pseudomonadota bacterium]